MIGITEAEFIYINLFHNEPTLVIKGFGSKYHLLNPRKTHRGRRKVFLTPNDPS